MKTFTKIHFVLFLTLLLAITALSQDLPDKIRGYKVYEGSVRVTSAVDNKTQGFPDDYDASVNIGPPKIANISLTGLTIEIPAEVRSFDQSGKVHFLTFHDIRINGIPAEVEEYSEPFEFKKEQATTLPKPPRIFLRADRIALTAWNEIMDSKEDWLITGRVFIFGKFKKMGLSFKRVVPVDVSIKIKNPLTDYKKKIIG